MDTTTPNTSSEDFHPDLFLRRAQSAIRALFGNMNTPINAATQKVAEDAAAGLALDLTALAFEINNNLNRIASAVEQQAALASVDIEATIKNGIAAGIEDAVNQRNKDEAKREYIGRKPT